MARVVASCASVGEVYDDGRLPLEHGNWKFDASLRDGAVHPLIGDFVSHILEAVPKFPPLRCNGVHGREIISLRLIMPSFSSMMP